MPTYHVSSVTKSPSTIQSVGGRTNAWSGPTAVSASDNVYANGFLTTAVSNLDRLWSTNYGFNIPATADVCAVQSFIEYKFSRTGGKRHHRYVLAGVPILTSASPLSLLSAATDVTGQDFTVSGVTPSSVNDSTFGFFLEAQLSATPGSFLSVDRMQITITYTAIDSSTLGVQSSEYGHEIRSVSVIQNPVTIDVKSSEYDSEVVSVDTIQTYTIAPQSSEYGHEIRSVALTQRHAIAPQSSEYDHEIKSPRVEGSGYTNADSSEYDHEIRSVSLLRTIPIPSSEYDHEITSVSLSNNVVVQSSEYDWYQGDERYDTGYVSPSSGLSISAMVGDGRWLTPNRVSASDNVYASVTAGSSEILFARKFNFALPSDSIVQGFQLRYERKSNAGGNEQEERYLVFASVAASGENRQQLGATANSDFVSISAEAYSTAGDASAMFGMLTADASASRINAESFGWGVAVSGGVLGTSVDHMQVRMYYTVPRGPTITVVTGELGVQSSEHEHEIKSVAITQTHAVAPQSSEYDFEAVSVSVASLIKMVDPASSEYGHEIMTVSLDARTTLYGRTPTRRAVMVPPGYRVIKPEFEDRTITRELEHREVIGGQNKKTKVHLQFYRELD